ncbi:MAG: DUF1800 family protein, partial [Armatimonadetes bacterium]|nr:DUF1800 family protein [Armatimonadota bacterium]
PHCAIKPMLRPILLDALAVRGDVRPSLKRPFDFAVSALRALGADTDGGPAIHAALADMGQALFQWPMPDGFADRAAAWTGNLLPRWNFALDLCAGRLAGTSVDLERLVATQESPDRITEITSAIVGRADSDPEARRTASAISPNQSGAETAPQHVPSPAQTAPSSSATSGARERARVREETATRPVPSPAQTAPSSSATSDARERARVREEIAALALCSPAFQWRG